MSDPAPRSDPVSAPSAASSTDDETVRVWLVERTYSDDEQNLIILVYATPDGERYFRKERALTSSTDIRETTAALDVAADDLGTVRDDERERYAVEATRMADEHDPDDAI
ncbi:hypothetical protein Halru_2924 [Halovivax ruber XH-70]|uniref:DUF7967 domain-containing protein n=1 Tax=Halovivax ruber (strain DSM 18193 / JCM 13892 / XH-70) TaxID=797302 RepID=L0IFG0_HALRX|nr:hypothetical protein [Halovivax ruber]AGB17494.1 hypothetical protein Halru_2924 [Halovivax ruber XH-70]